MKNQTRRNFIVQTAAAVAVAPFAFERAFAAHSSGKLRKAIMYQTVNIKDASVIEKFKLIKEAGFEGVEPLSHMDTREVLAAGKEHGLEFPSVCCNTHWTQPLSSPNPGTRERGLDGLKQALRDAKIYGSKSVLLVPAVVSKAVSYEDAYKRSQEEIRKAIPLAEELGVKIAIENVWNKFLLSPVEAARYVDEFKSPMVGWHFDIGNIINFGWPEHWIRTLNKRIVALHIKEFSTEKASKEGAGAGFNVEFLKGSNDWPGIMKALTEIGYTGWGIAEQGGANSAEGLKKLSSEMDKIFAS